MTPNRFEIVRGRGPGEMDLIRSFLTYNLMQSHQIPVTIQIGPQWEEGNLYISGLRHRDSERNFQFWGELFISIPNREDHLRNRFRIEGYYDSHKREGSFSIDSQTPYRLVYVYADDKPEHRCFYASFGQYTSGVSDSLLEEMKTWHWNWEEPGNMRYFYEHLEGTLDDLMVGSWRPICEIRVTGDEQNPELETINL